MAGVKRKFKTWTANLPWKKSRVNVSSITSSDKENIQGQQSYGSKDSRRKLN